MTEARRFALAVALLASLSLGAGYDESIRTSEAARAVDVVGVRLGMTPQQVQAALAAHDAGLAVEVHENRMDLGGGESLPYVQAVDAKAADKRETLNVAFTRPPRAALVASIARSESFPYNEGPAYERVRQAIVGKYGEPDSEEFRGAAGGLPPGVDPFGMPTPVEVRFDWLLDEGKASCFYFAVRAQAPMPQTLRSEPAGCSALLSVEVHVANRAVTLLNSVLVDPVLAAASMREHQELFERRREEQRQRQIERAPLPKL